MSHRIPDPDDYPTILSAYADTAEVLKYVRDTLAYVAHPQTPVWITGDNPHVTGAVLVSLQRAQLLLGQAVSNLLAKENAASCQNAAPRLSETTEPQAL